MRWLIGLFLLALSCSGYAENFLLPNGVPLAARERHCAVADMTNVRKNLAISIAPPAGGSDLKMKASIQLPVRKGTPIVGALRGQGGTAPYVYSELTSVLSGIGLTLHADGTITGTPNAQGHYSFTAQVQDAALAVFPCTFALNILSPMFVILNAPTPSEVGTHYAYSFRVGGYSGTAADVLWTSSGLLPPGMVLGGQGSLSDGSDTPTTLLTAAPVVVGSTLKLQLQTPFVQIPSATFEDGEWIYAAGGGHEVYGQIVSGGGTNIVYLDIATAASYITPTSMVAGALVTMTVGGNISGTPTASGGYYFTVRATDTLTGNYIEFSTHVEVVAAPVLTFDDVGSVPTVGSGFLPPVYIGVPYRATVTATGGVAPFSYYDALGGLTGSGLTVDPTTGTVSGTITDTSLIADFDSAYLVEVGATDALGATAVVAQAGLAVLLNIPSTDGTFAANSNSLYPTQAAVKAYVDANAGGGYTGHIRGASATIASATKNRITANSVVLTTPASPADFDDFLVTIESALTGCAVTANSGQTVNGLSSLNLDITPCSIWFQYNLAATNWFVRELRLGTI